MLAPTVSTADLPHLLGGEFGSSDALASWVSLRVQPCPVAVPSREQIGATAGDIFVAALYFLWVNSRPVLIALVAATLPASINGVVLRGPVEEVVRIHAWGIIALVQSFMGRCVSVVQEECESMSTNAYATSRGKGSVAAACSAASPFPALGWTALVYVAPEFLDLFGRKLWNWLRMSSSHVVSSLGDLVRAGALLQQHIGPHIYFSQLSEETLCPC